MGRPHKCPACGAEGKSVSKGMRKTKTIGLRRIRLCKACGRKFTPKNQKPSELAEPPAPDKPPLVSPASAAAGDATTAETASGETAAALAPNAEAIDHPRF
jgi:hypothetical protein